MTSLLSRFGSLNRPHKKLWALLFLSQGLVLSSCMTRSVDQGSQKNKEVTSQATAQAAPQTTTQTTAAPSSSETAATQSSADLPAPAHAAPLAQAPEAHQAPASHRHAGEISYEKALGWLKNGNKRYLKGFLRNDGQSKSDIERLSKGQKPHSIVLSCSDSRVPPEVVFDQKLGEIFVVRTAGQTLDYGALASIEYALAHLGSNLIVVMGHTSCGAVKAALTTSAGQDAGSPYLNQLVAQIKPRLNKTARPAASEGLTQEGWENVRGVTEDLMTKSQIIRDAVTSGEVKIQPALYHLGSGQVEWEPGTVH